MIEFLKNIFRRKVNKVKETQDANDHLQAYAMMSDWKRGFSEQKYENFIGDISFNERDVWPRAKKDNFKEYADLIKRKITEFSKIAKKPRFVCVNYVGHGSVGGIYYTNQSGESSLISIPEFIKEMNSAKYPKKASRDFSFSGCALGVGIASDSSEPDKVARKNKYEAELSDALLPNSNVVIFSGNKSTSNELNTKILKESVALSASAFERALIAAAISPQTIKLARKDKKGAFVAYKSNFELPKEGEIDVDVVKSQMKKRLQGIFDFISEKTNLGKEELKRLKVLKEELEGEILDEKAKAYFSTFLSRKTSDKKYDKVEDWISRVSFDITAEGGHIIGEANSEQNYKLVLKLAESQKTKHLFKGSTGKVAQIIDAARRYENSNRYVIEEYIKYLQKAKITSLQFDETLFSNPRTQHEENFVGDFIKAVKAVNPAIAINVSLPKNYPQSKMRKVEYVVGKENLGIITTYENEPQALANAGVKSLNFCKNGELGKEFFNDDFCLSRAFDHEFEAYKDNMAQRGTERVVIDLQGSNIAYVNMFAKRINQIEGKKVEVVVLVPPNYKDQSLLEAVKRDVSCQNEGVKFVGYNEVKLYEDEMKKPLHTDIFCSDAAFKQFSTVEFSLQHAGRNLSFEAIKEAPNRLKHEHYDGVVPSKSVKKTPHKTIVVEPLQSGHANEVEV